MKQKNKQVINTTFIKKKSKKFSCKIERMRVQKVIQDFRKAAVLKLQIRQNNIFSTFFNFKPQRVLKTRSSGVFKVKVSKKRLKSSCSLFLKKLFAFIKKYFRKKRLIIILTSPRYLRKFILRYFLIKLKKYRLLFCLDPKKCYNGCRVKKLKRKKYKKYRILK